MTWPLVHALLAQRALLVPDNVAVAEVAEEITYSQLMLRSSHYGTMLPRGESMVVGNTLPMSIDFIASVIGGMQLGHSTFAIDDSEVRMSTMARSQCDFVWTRDAGSDPTVRPSGEHRCSTRSAERSCDPCGSDVVAFLAFTSGTLGPPRIVAIPHRAVTSTQSGDRAAFRLTAADSVMFATPRPAARTLVGMFSALFAGARVAIPPAGATGIGDELVDAMIALNVTVLMASPAILEVLNASGRLGSCTSLRAVFAGGEALPPRVAQAFATRSRAHLFNTYGQTEALSGMQMEWHPASPQNVVSERLPPHMLILSPDLAKVARGGIGELHVSGPSVALGYVDDPSATASRFVPDPYSLTGGDRLYRTGDIAIELPNGCIQLLGRADRSVTIDGRRISLPFLEDLIVRHPSVSACAVIVNQDRGARLRAFVVGVGELSPAEMHLFLREGLSTGIMPIEFQFVEALSRNRAGKIDYEALRQVRIPGSSRGSSRVPCCEEEETVLSVFRGLLSDPDLDLEADLFSQGATSLTLIRAISDIYGITAVKLSLPRVIEQPSVRAIAELLRTDACPSESSGDGG